MKKKGDLENSILFFFSDHGYRFTEFAKTPVGAAENNLPFLFLVIPPRLKKLLPDLVVNAHNNVRRLVTAFDFHKTLQHLLHLQTPNNSSESWSNEANDGSQESFSLLTHIPKNRTCDTAGIPPAYCSCEAMITTDTSAAATISAGSALIEAINAALTKVSDICENWKLHRIIEAKKRTKTEEYSIHVETRPKAEFQGWVDMRGGRTKAKVSLNQVWRNDIYGNTSACVLQRHYSLKEYCLCKQLK